MSGVTCSDCNNGYNPHYFVQAKLILGSDMPEPFLLFSSNEQELSSEFNMDVISNPIQDGMLLLKTKSDLNDIGVTIYNIAGKSLKYFTFKNSDELNTQCIDISHLASGNYFINVRANEGSKVLKIIKE